jgi:uncharacterized membrane protein YkoI
MKKLVILFVCILLSANFAQKKSGIQIPQNVKDKFAASYSSAIKIKWEVEKDNFEVNFKLGKENKSVLYDKAANVLEVETEIKISDLPVKVREAVAKDHPGFKILEAAKIEKNGKTVYEAEVRKGNNKTDLIYDEQGRLEK